MSGKSSRIANFFKMSTSERVHALAEQGWLAQEDAAVLLGNQQTLSLNTADKMIENVIGVFGLPMGVALNFLINGQDYVLPLAVEEPSIVAGLSGTAKLARAGGGFHFTAPESLITGQVQLTDLKDPEGAAAALLAREAEIVHAANATQPNMVARGGGVRSIEVHRHTGPHSGQPMVVLHLVIDTQDAMGANLVNAVCEHIAPLAEQITGGIACLRILSNLTDRAIVHANVKIAADQLAGRGMTGEEVRDAIVVANDLALVDPYRAATHNKGIMNGVDAITVATGNDWRAIEAAAHAYAARDGQYRSLTTWRVADDGALLGEIEIPVKVGTVGGSLQTNPTVAIAHRLLGSPNAPQLAGIIGVVGLAQNFAALRSLATNGIQQNHMRLHARSVASSAAVPQHLFEQVVEALIESGEIKVWNAQRIVTSLQTSPTFAEEAEGEDATYIGRAAGKVILLGEHAVVYGQPALAVPIPLALSATVGVAEVGVQLRVPNWGLDINVSQHDGVLAAALRDILARYQITRPMIIIVDAQIPKAMGLGGSAALAVAVLRALNDAEQLGWGDEEVNGLAFELEHAAHGTPSGVDNTVSTFAKPIVFSRADDGSGAMKDLMLGCDLELVIGFGSEEGATSKTVASVAALRAQHAHLYDATINTIGQLTRAAQGALERGDLDTAGHLMNLCHGQLNALQVSTPQLEQMVHLAREAGAKGAKLTGGGGGGSIVALTPGRQQEVADALNKAGYRTLVTTVKSR